MNAPPALHELPSAVSVVPGAGVRRVVDLTRFPIAHAGMRCLQTQPCEVGPHAHRTALPESPYA